MPSSRAMPPRSRIGRDFLFMCGCPPNHPGPFLKVPVLLNSTAVTQILNVLPSKQAFNVEQILDCSNLVAFMIGMSPRQRRSVTALPSSFQSEESFGASSFCRASLRFYLCSGCGSSHSSHWWVWPSVQEVSRRDGEHGLVGLSMGDVAFLLLSQISPDSRMGFDLTDLNKGT